ncbi:MAG: MFS transporter [Methanobacteriota archaeon]|nr:MAG: MFS transporter [Euryarchaeota archaeon]
MTENQQEQRIAGPTQAEPAAGTGLAAHARLILAVIIAAAFLDVVDFSVVQVALPTIQREFLAPLAESQWVTGVYGLTLAGFLMVSGRAGDVYGQKRMFLVGIVLFTLASLTAGLAPSLLSLVASRAIQGIAAAMTTATALAILAATFPEGPERNRAFGILVSVLSAGFAAGSIAGGVLTAAFGWRSVMFVNVPIGAAATLLAQRYIARNGGRAVGRLDIPGAVTVTAGLILLVYAFTVAATDGLFTVQTAVPLALSVLALVGFLAIEYRSKAPLMPLAFLRRRTTLSANVLSLFVSSSAGALIVLTVYLQQILGYSPLEAGLAFLPAAAIFFVVGGWGSSWLMNRLGMKRVLVASSAFVTLGLALLAPLPVAAGYWGILPGTMVWALGASIGFPALAIAGLAGTKPGEEGLASGLIQTSQRLGFPLGLSMVLTVASAFDPQLGLSGYRYAFAAAAVLAALGFGIALRFRNERAPILVERATPDPRSVGEPGEVE